MARTISREKSTALSKVLPPSTPLPFFSLNFPGRFCLRIPIMSDEVYEGAIGIDLGTSNSPKEKNYPTVRYANVCRQARPTLALPTTRAPMSKSVCARSSQACDDSRLTILSTVANEQGSFTTPSFVSFTSEERLIGEAAKNQAAMNPENTVFDVK